MPPHMKLLFDADGLIKLQRAELLDLVARTFTCMIPEVVYHEVVTQGIERLYPDAHEIERTVRTARVLVQPASHSEPLEPGLGMGEAAVLDLFQQGKGERIVSDDRRFLALLSRQGVPFIVPAALIVLMTRQGTLDIDHAHSALERLRPWIRDEVYQQAVRDLEEGRATKP